MSNNPTNDTTLQSTKQMLDELDALMEKMLSLPTNDADDAPPFPQEVIKPPAWTPTLSATLTLLEPPAPGPLTSPPTASSYFSTPEPLSAHPSVNPPHFASDPALPGPAPIGYQPALQPEPLTNQVVPSSVLRELQPLLERIPEPATPVTTLWIYLPLLWINQAFDRSTTILGPAGFLLRSQVIRALLGLSGVALMVLAVGWFLKDWLGWN
jgi:hypothetical protein